MSGTMSDPTSAGYLERTIAELRHQLAAARAELEQWKRDVLFLRGEWSSLGGRACPACVYEGGRFVRLCKVHEEFAAAQAEVERLQRWVDDLQSGMYINCVYCGHQYGPNSQAATMREALHTHVENCVHHPLWKARQHNSILEAHNVTLRGALERVKDCAGSQTVIKSPYPIPCGWEELYFIAFNALTSPAGRKEV